MKKLLCALLALLIAAAFSALAGDGENYLEYRNPLYPDVVLKPYRPPETLRGACANESTEEYASVSDAAVYLKGLMKQRSENVVLRIVSSESAAATLMRSILEAAFAHTGEPDEGDYLRWVFGGYQGGYNYFEDGDGIHYEFSLTITYYTDLAQEEEMNGAVDLLLTALDLEDKSEYQKISAIYDYITANVSYDKADLNDESYLLKYTAYAALINKTAVCQGYAGLFYRLALEAGVDARMITGWGGGGNHAWNIACIEGTYYCLDATWDAGCAEYAFFLKGTGNFPDHTPYSDFLPDYGVSEDDFVPPVTLTGECGDALVWTYTEGMLTIEGTGAMWNYDDDANPPPFIALDMLSAVIEDGVTSIGEYAFAGCVDLHNITIPESVVSIGTYAFCGCESLTVHCRPGTAALACALEYGLLYEPTLYDYDMILPAGISEIAALSFRGTAVETVYIPDGCLRIGVYAFAECGALKQIRIPESAAYIAPDALLDCGLGTLIVGTPGSAAQSFAAVAGLAFEAESAVEQ